MKRDREGGHTHIHTHRDRERQALTDRCTERQRGDKNNRRGNKENGSRHKKTGARGRCPVVLGSESSRAWSSTIE